MILGLCIYSSLYDFRKICWPDVRRGNRLESKIHPLPHSQVQEYVGPTVRILMRRRFIFCLVRAIQMAATVKGASRGGRGEERARAPRKKGSNTLFALLSERVAGRESKRGGGHSASTAAAQSPCIPPSFQLSREGVSRGDSTPI